MNTVKHKFKVGDYVERIVNANETSSHYITWIRIMEIWIQKCHTTTQVFYDAREHAAKLTNFGSSNRDQVVVEIGVHYNGQNASGFIRVREDEIQSISKKTMERIKELKIKM